VKIQIITCSIRDGRATPRVARWAERKARELWGEGVEIEAVDLKSFELPLYTEDPSPLDNKDRHPEGNVKAWLDTLARADGYVFVTPEYNHGMPSGLKNALDFVDVQLQRKPVAVIAHGSVGGARSIEQLKLVLNSSIGAIPVPQTVTLVGPVSRGEMLSEDGEALSPALSGAERALVSTLGSLRWYTEALAQKRNA
jgi:NAD(P)H-dependent FMN reductase